MADYCVESNTFNVTVDQIAKFTYSQGSKFFITIALPIVTAFGLFNNFGFLFVIYRVKQMRTIINFYLGNLAVADACSLVIIAIKYILTYIANEPIDSHNAAWKNPVGCYLPNTLTFSFICCSVFLVMLVAFERFLAVCYPLQHLRINTKSRAIKITIAIWVLSFGLAATGNSPSSTVAQCYELPNEVHGQTTFLVYECLFHCLECIFIFRSIDVGQFFFAVIFTSILYGFIIMKLYKREVAEQCEDKGMKMISAEARNAVARLVIINSIIFFLCLLPYKIILMQDLVLRSGGPFFMSPEYVHILSWMGRVTTAVNASINPVVYSVTNSRYRSAFYEAFKLQQNKETTINGSSTKKIALSSTSNTTQSEERHQQ